MAVSDRKVISTKGNTEIHSNSLMILLIAKTTNPNGIPITNNLSANSSTMDTTSSNILLHD